MPEGKGNNRLTLQRHHIVRSLVVILAYFATGYAGLQLPFFGTSVTLVWPPSGIAIAAMVFWGWRYFPAVFIGALLVNLATSPSVPAALMIAAGNTLAAVLPALLITRLAGNYPLAQFRSMLVFLALGAVCSPAIAALLGSTTLSMIVIGNFDQFGEIWQGWFLGDLVGAIVVGPLTLRLMNRQPVSRSLQHYGELAFIVIAAVVLASAVQTTPLISKPEYLFIFVSVPLVIWGAVRYGLLGAVLINAVIVADIIVFAALGNKTFVGVGLNTGLRNLYGYVIAISVGTLFLAAGMERIAAITTRTLDGRQSEDVHRLRRTLSIIIGVIGFGVSGLASWYTYTQLVAADRSSTDQYRLAFEASLREELGGATDALIAVRTLFDVHGSISANTFDAMIAPWVNRRPGVAALEWAPHVERRARGLIEENAELRGVTNFSIRALVDGELQTSSEQDTYYPVFFVFPRSGNEKVIGFDMMSEPSRRRALETALQTGNVTLTEPLELVQANSAVVTSLAFLAVENRRDRTGPPLGVAIGVLRLTDMISRAARVARIPLDFEIHLADLKSESEKKLIYSNRLANYAIEHIREELEKPFNPNVSNFTFGYRDWTIVLHPSERGFGTLLYWQPWAIFVFGSTVSILLLIYLRSLNRTEKYIVNLVETRTRELEDARASAENAMNRAQQADRAKSEFIAHMSHEFRSPMTSILGYAQLASDSLDKDANTETLRSYLSTIRGAGRHVLSLIGDILDISKIEAGKLVLEENPFDLHHICEEVVSMMLVPARAQESTLELDIDPKLPRYVTGDPVRLKQVLTNLVSNAIKFTKQGKVLVVVQALDITEDAVSFRISVRDEGIGIAQNKLEAIFDAFTQADTTTTRRYGGTGLGLTICQRMVQAMGGRVQVESQEGKGSRFWFDLTLPRSCETDVARQEGQTANPGDDGSEKAEAADPGAWNLLLVEDIEINRILAQKLLEAQGHTITTAADGQIALDILAGADFDAVLMDLHMPVLDGIEATRRIRAFDDPVKATIPVLALTADISNDNLENFHETGFDAYCTKPLDIAMIDAELARLIHRKFDARLARNDTPAT
ncbi:CHASE domain-containing protein [Thalassospira profundimaris]|uniref:CHASE domain-containing protein n=1 Tax=Thalassospira profundimaris TaxID=502049 RepID=UPI0002871AF4|nr:CHASE domain-containing protein [Thalassospira profundimaris]EKF08358.1 sensor protein [Thalassospira profundimaris WP0211]